MLLPIRSITREKFNVWGVYLVFLEEVVLFWEEGLASQDLY